MVPCWCNLHFALCCSRFEQEAIPMAVEACRRPGQQLQVQGARTAFVQEPELKTDWHLEPVLVTAWQPNTDKA